MRWQERQALANPRRNYPMFAGTLTRNVETAAAEYTGMIHSTRFDVAIQLEARAKMSERSPDFDVTAINKSGRKVRIGTAWNETGTTSGNPYISMQIDVGLGPFRVNAVQNEDQRGGQTFSIIPFTDSGDQDRDASGGLSLVA